MGIELEKDMKKEVCHGYKYDGKRVVWRKGIIGTLTDEQETRLCSIFKTEDLPPKLARRFEIMRGLEVGYPYCFSKEIKNEIQKSKDISDEAKKIIKNMPICPE